MDSAFAAAARGPIAAIPVPAIRWSGYRCRSGRGARHPGASTVKRRAVLRMRPVRGSGGLLARLRASAVGQMRLRCRAGGAAGPSAVTASAASMPDRARDLRSPELRDGHPSALWIAIIAKPPRSATSGASVREAGRMAFLLSASSLRRRSSVA